MKDAIDYEYQQDLQEAVKCLKNGGIILYPTDTIWGIGCDARNAKAVERIFRLKKRLDSKSMLVLVNNEAAMERIADDIPDVAWELIEAAVNPLTLILDGAKGVDSLLIANDGSLGIRITKEKFSNELCRRLGAPLVSTSANRSGENPPLNFQKISPEIIEGVDYVVKYRQNDNTPSQPSNIIKLGKGGEVRVIR